MGKMENGWWLDGDKAIAEYISERIEFELNTGCWLWTRASQPDGYGVFRIGPRLRHAHREMLRIRTGREPEGHKACHKCDTPRCCNPDHLWWGTQKQNCRDAVEKGRLHFQINPEAARKIRSRQDSRGAKSSVAKLTWDDVRKIRSLYPGIGVYRIARQFGVSKTNVQLIVNHSTWKEQCPC